MTDTNAVIAVYETHSGAENAVKDLQKSGFDMKKLSVVGKDYHTDEQVVGYYNAGDRMKYWGKTGAFWGGLLLGPRRWPVVGRRTACVVDRWCFRRRGSSRRVERAWRWPLQHRYTEEQSCTI